MLHIAPFLIFVHVNPPAQGLVDLLDENQSMACTTLKRKGIESKHLNRNLMLSPTGLSQVYTHH
jgi:hypothetical protein